MTLRVAGVAVPDCKGLSTMDRRPTYMLFCREISFAASYAHMGGGVTKKWRAMTRGRGGGHDTPQKWWRHLWTAPYHHHHHHHHHHHDNDDSKDDLHIVLADNKLASVGKVHQQGQSQGGDIVDCNLRSSSAWKSASAIARYLYSVLQFVIWYIELTSSRVFSTRSSERNLDEFWIF